MADWLRRLRGSGVLGINRRNLEYVLALNPRERFRLVDDKIRAKEVLASAAIPFPRTIAVAERRGEIPNVLAELRRQPACVVKPAAGFGGQGILVLRSAGNGWVDTAGERVREEDLRFHMAAILSGMYSLDHLSDRVLTEERIEEDPSLRALHGGGGVSDVRVIVCNSELAMAMLRLPCAASGGTANLHAGGIGVGIDIGAGTTTSAIQADYPVDRHPDTGVRLAGCRVPHWGRILELVRPVNETFGMGYLGVDIAIDARRGPVCLEVNARPGLAIQLANRCGLLHELPHPGPHG